VVERLFAADLAYLQEFYRYINEIELTPVRATCPNCGQPFDVHFPTG
jgi:hypothetical protein